MGKCQNCKETMNVSDRYVACGQCEHCCCMKCMDTLTLVEPNTYYCYYCNLDRLASNIDTIKYLLKFTQFKTIEEAKLSYINSKSVQL